MSDVVEVLYRDTVVVESGDNKVIVIEPKVIINQVTGDSQIQSDWNQADNTKKDFIKNKPTIPDELKDLAEDSTHRTVTDVDKSYWSGKANIKPTVLPVNTNKDTLITDGVYQIDYNIITVNVAEDSTSGTIVNQFMTSDDGTVQYRQYQGVVWSDWKEVAWWNYTLEELDLKVDKVDGKGLSTNDYTAIDKAIVDKVAVNPVNPENMYLNGNKEYTEIALNHSQLRGKNDETAYQHITANEKNILLLADRFRINATDFVGGTASPYQGIVIGGLPVIVKKFLNQNSYYYTNTRYSDDIVYLDNIRFILTESVMPTTGQYIDFTINGTQLRHTFTGTETQNQVIVVFQVIGNSDTGSEANTFEVSGTYLQKIGIVSLDFYYNRSV